MSDLPYLPVSPRFTSAVPNQPRPRRPLLTLGTLRLAGPAVPALALALVLALSSGCQRSAAGSGPQPTAVPAVTGSVVAPLPAPLPVAPTADVAGLVERLKPTVVNITTSQ